VVYADVTKLDVDGQGNPNGKSLYVYSVVNDVSVGMVESLLTQGVWMVSSPWRNGFMTHEYIYKSNGTNFTPVTIKQFIYQLYRPDTVQNLKIKPLYINEGGCGVYGDTTLCRSTGSYDDQNINYSHFYAAKVPTYSGAILLQSESDTTFDSSGNKIVAIHNNYYDDVTHIFPTRKETFNSKGEDLVDVIRYPHDLAATGNVYQTMLNRNIVSPPVRFVQRKNSMQLDSTNINYSDWNGNGTLLLEKSVDANTLSSTMERRLNLDKYDQYGDILQQEKAKAPYQSYQWGYYGQYPVAKVANAPVNDIFYDSFEEGNGTSALNDSKTGHYSYSGSYSKTLTGLDTGNYILSYWSKTGGAWVWSFVNTIHVTGSSYTITLSGPIDDVRFYPANAQMSTYTYDPLIGMTSSTDAKGEVTYYEYDSFQRLQNIKDKDGSIIKSYNYHYQGQ
jgi:YD repeat-containing protein